MKLILAGMFLGCPSICVYVCICIPSTQFCSLMFFFCIVSVSINKIFTRSFIHACSRTGSLRPACRQLLIGYYTAVLDEQNIGNESALIQLAQCWFHGLAISNAKILIYFSDKIYGSNSVKQHSETVTV